MIKEYTWPDKIILIAEDEELNYKYLETILRKSRVKLYWAKDGIEVIELVKSGIKFNLILMDIQMPNINGIEATEAVRKIDKTVPIIAQTAFILPEDITLIKNAGCNDYLAKPIRKNSLYDKINEFI